VIWTPFWVCFEFGLIWFNLFLGALLDLGAIYKYMICKFDDMLFECLSGCHLVFGNVEFEPHNA
jgi:hypothetical protein